jgi:hypothetical protein
MKFAGTALRRQKANWRVEMHVGMDHTLYGFAVLYL